MAMISFRDFSFEYPVSAGADAVGVNGVDEGACARKIQLPACGELSAEINEGAFCLLTGMSGSGKTTLLRACKPELAPRGAYAGTLEVCGVRLVDEGRVVDAMSALDSARSIGFVMQDPDAQIVCDTVWHELAFGLENLGVAPDLMRRRVAEVAHYLGIVPLVERRCAELSGGQKQLVNLAAVLALRPSLILLDEPLAQLNPAARQQFAALLARVNRELGVTVVVATHMPEELAAFATAEIALPQSDALSERVSGFDVLSDALSERVSGFAVCASDVFARYEDAPWVLRGLDLELRVGTVHAVVGGNGCGKTTLLRVLGGGLKPRRGRVCNECENAQAYLPQDPKAVFACDSVEEELCEWQLRAGYSDAEIASVKEHFGLAGLEALHPYHLSGGQQQMLALAKMLLLHPELLLLDEPTKGLDARACAQVVRVLREFCASGGTAVIATHDLDFVAACADEATLLFDGQAACTQQVPQFFEDNLIWRPREKSPLAAQLAAAKQATGVPA